MKSLTRIVLPILLVAGLVFGITFIQMYSGDETRPDYASGDGNGGPKLSEKPLVFGLTKSIAPKETPNSQGVLEVPETQRHLKYWDSEIEVGMPGHFEFWCQNRNTQPVTVRIPMTNCQCAGAEIAVVPPDAYRDYLIGSAIAGGPLCPVPGPMSALVHATLDHRLNWNALHTGDERKDQTVPAAESAAAPQVALVRLAWTAKGEPGPKGISAELYASIGSAVPSHTQLGVEITVVPGFYVLRREGLRWETARELPFGDLNQGAVEKISLYLASATRSFLLPTVDGDDPTPCITWTEPVPAPGEDLVALRSFIAGTDATMRRFKCLYRMDVTIRERTEGDVGGKKEVRELDLGPIDRRINVASANAGSWAVRIKGRVLGDVTFLTGADSGRIDLGTFAADQDRTRDVIILTDRPGLTLSLVDAETAPNNLKVKLEPLEVLNDRQKYRLRVTVPKSTLFGALPEKSVVVLKTNSATPRRLRLPVRGMTFESSGPRL